MVEEGVRVLAGRQEKRKQDGGTVSFNTRRIIALVVVLLASTLGGLLAVASFDARGASVLGVVAGAAVGMVLMVIWASRAS